jgi:hypothetical protein
VTKVVVVNNNNINYAHTFDGAEIVIGDSGNAFGSEMQQCGDTISSLSAGESFSLDCSISGRFICVRQQRAVGIYIAEVNVDIDNIEFTAGTTSSSKLQYGSLQ